jgi:tyrosyl-tRNA synthetase
MSVTNPITNMKGLRDPELLGRTIDQIFSVSEFSDQLGSRKKLRIKYGVDVTAPFLHIGHAVNLWMMRELQEQGHILVFLIGDFTTRIGDPTGRNETRPIISKDEIERNANEFINQISNVVLTRPDVFEVRRNSEWYDRMAVDKFLGLMSMVTHAGLISRDMFKQRISSQIEIYMHELIYPLLQGYDSVMLESDLTIVGSDQLFNENMGRFYQERFGQKPQVIITSRITPGIDGKSKQSKSLNNYIAIADTARDKFGKVMSIPDELIIPYFEVYTTVPLAHVSEMEHHLAGGTNPMKLKQRLAAEIVRRYHGSDAAQSEEHWFLDVFSRRQVASDIQTLRVASPSVLPVDLVKYARPDLSKSQIRRLLSQNGVALNGVKLAENDVPFLKEGDVLRVGKFHSYRLAFL